MTAQRTINITGAGSGIGRATAALLQQTGWRVFAAMRRKLIPFRHGLNPPTPPPKPVIELPQGQPNRAAAERLLFTRVGAAIGSCLSTSQNGALLIEARRRRLTGGMDASVLAAKYLKRGC